MSVDVEQLFRDKATTVERELRRRFPGVDKALIEDACAQAWAITWTRRAAVENDNPTGFVITVARNELIGLLARRRETLAERIEDVCGPAREGDPELALALRETLRVFAGLSANQRRALALRLAGFSYKEIAEIENVTHTWVNRHVSEGNRALRARCGEERPARPAGA